MERFCHVRKKYYFCEPIISSYNRQAVPRRGVLADPKGRAAGIITN